MISVSPVGDAGAAALCQFEGVLQLLNGISVLATTSPVLCALCLRAPAPCPVLANQLENVCLR